MAPWLPAACHRCFSAPQPRQPLPAGENCVPSAAPLSVTQAPPHRHTGTPARFVAMLVEIFVTLQSFHTVVASSETLLASYRNVSVVKNELKLSKLVAKYQETKTAIEDLGDSWTQTLRRKKKVKRKTVKVRAKGDENATKRWGAGTSWQDEMEYKMWVLDDVQDKIRDEQGRAQSEVRSPLWLRLWVTAASCRPPSHAKCPLCLWCGICVQYSCLLATSVELRHTAAASWPALARWTPVNI